MTPYDQDELRRAREAAMWHEELESKDSSCHEAFAGWLRESPSHVREFLAISYTSLLLAKMDPQRRIDVNALIARARQERVVPFAVKSTDVLEVPHQKETVLAPVGRRSTPRRYLGLAAGTVAAVVAVLAIWLASSAFRGQTYATKVGEQRSVKLADGSIVNLNTDSRVRVYYTAQERAVSLAKGEALFSVEHDPAARPFRVSAGLAELQAIGTEFNVYRQRTQTTVSVVKGEINVLLSGKEEGASSAASPQEQTGPSSAGSGWVVVSAGEQATIAPSGQVQKNERADVQSAVSWQERRLVFKDEALADVAEEFNRYNTRKIRVEGDTLRARAINGIFSADHPQSLFLYLQSRDATVIVDTSGSDYVIRSQTAP